MIQSVLDLLITAARNPFLTSVVLGVVFILILRWTPLYEALLRFGSGRGRTLLVLVSAGILVLYLGIVVWYLLLPGFAGELEPMMATVSWLVQRGEPMYHDFDSASRYSVLYGPTGFLTNGFFLQLFGPSILSAKLSGTLFALLGVLCLYLALAARVSWRMALALTALAALLYGLGGSFSYMIRPDSLLITGVCFGLMCAARARPILAVAGVAAALGYCVNLKIHAGLFFLPILVVVYRRLGWRGVLLSAGGGFLLFLVPFLFHPQVSARNYFVWLTEATRHGLDFPTFVMTAQLALYLGLSVLIFLLPGFSPRDALRQQRYYFLALLVCIGGVTLLASKHGAGLNHLIPTIPLVLYGLAELLTEMRREAGDWTRILTPPRLGLVLAVLVAAFITGAVTEYRSIQMTRSYSQRSQRVVQDLEEIMATYPDQKIGMAYGGEGDQFLLTSYRPLLVFAGHPVLVDVINVMETDFAGRPLPRQTYEALASGTITLWLVPRQMEPFHKQNWYPTEDNVFPEDFQNLFRENYTRRGNSRFFDLWFHRDVPPEVGGE